MHPISRSLAAWALAGLAATLATPLYAADAAAPAAKSTYLKERADCDAGRTAEDRATCLKEAGAAQVERKRNTLDNNGSLPQNATERCDSLPAQEKSACMTRAKGIMSKSGPHKSVSTVTSGSVAGGGILKETTTTTTGSPTIIVIPAAPPASGTTN
ncbi:MAG: hypothetical protein ABJA61_06580 [Caldimonas sp.]